MANPNFGTQTTLDTLRSITNQNVLTFGEDKALAAIRLELGILNAQVTEALNAFSETTTDTARRTYGAQGSMDFEEVDQWGTPDAQMYIPTVQSIGFPLRHFEIPVQWTRSAFDKMTPAELANAVDAVTKADRQNIYRALKRAIFGGANYTFRDRWDTDQDLFVKGLVNMDGQNIPLGPNGEVFNGSSHQHYLATASLVAGDISALLATVVEHYGDGEVVLYISKSQEATIRTFTANFTPYPAAAAAAVAGDINNLPRLNLKQPNNRAIGDYDGATVWVKPWVPPSYMFAYNTGVTKPLVRRLPSKGGSPDLALVFEDEAHQLRGRIWARDLGFGVYERTNGAVLYTGGGTYVIPTITTP